MASAKNPALHTAIPVPMEAIDGNAFWSRMKGNPSIDLPG
jgi:hypothetical protein